LATDENNGEALQALEQARLRGMKVELQTPDFPPQLHEAPRFARNRGR
jgi:hypothetical protein